jgi:hypothetical protein
VKIYVAALYEFIHAQKENRFSLAENQMKFEILNLEFILSLSLSTNTGLWKNKIV